MITAQQSQEKVYQKYAWLILFVLGILLVLNMLIVAGVEADPGDFAANTGAAWDEVSTAYPGVASSYTLSQRLVYVSFASLASFALIITYFGCRQGYRWAW